VDVRPLLEGYVGQVLAGSGYKPLVENILSLRRQLNDANAKRDGLRATHQKLQEEVAAVDATDVASLRRGATAKSESELVARAITETTGRIETLNRQIGEVEAKLIYGVEAGVHKLAKQESEKQLARFYELALEAADAARKIALPILFEAAVHKETADKLHSMSLKSEQIKGVMQNCLATAALPNAPEALKDGETPGLNTQPANGGLVVPEGLHPLQPEPA
jgi:hypothetical protein